MIKQEQKIKFKISPNDDITLNLIMEIDGKIMSIFHMDDYDLYEIKVEIERYHQSNTFFLRLRDRVRKEVQK